MNRRTFRTKSCNSPSTVAETHRADLLEAMFLLEGLGGGEDLGLTDILVVSANEIHEVEVLALLRVLERVRVDHLAIEEVGKVDRRVGFLCVVVGQESEIGKGPAEDVVDDQDRDLFVGTGYVGGVFTQLGFLSLGLAVPMEAGCATIRHGRG